MKNNSGSTMSPEGSFDKVYVKKYTDLIKIYKEDLKSIPVLRFYERKMIKRKIKYCEERIKEQS